ncbi:MULTISPECIES: PIG-L family deacetylase [unclassified Streptomyces]|uniref:PIG-L family deacetylase n=1 Tax=unclassified Streptomyces TaxID=2593676 RepID=UPI0033B7687C
MLASLAGTVVAGFAGGCTVSGPPSAPVTPSDTGAITGASTGKRDDAPVRRLGQERRRRFSSTDRTLVMQILAHPDDDLFFMNPDVVRTLASGVPVVSVYLTDGGSFGVNSSPELPAPPPDIPRYVSSRQQGLRQAYAEMVGAPLFGGWERTAVPLPGGRRAEVNRLEHDGRRVELVFLNLRMHAEDLGRPVNMAHLWGTAGVSLPTQPGIGSPVPERFSYTRPELVDALVALLRRYRPTLIRTLDPDPDAQVHDRRHPRGSDQAGYSDHPDHTAAALFTWRALAAWADGAARGTGVPAFQTETYRGYYNQRWPHNLSPETVALKTRYLNAYGGAPSWQCGNTAGCGDYSIGGDQVLKSKKGWVRSTHRRYPNAGPQAVAGADGSLTVYGVLGTRLARWTIGPSGKAGTPEDLGGGPLAPSISVVTAPDGRLMVFALRFSQLEGAVEHNVREIVMLRQRTPGGAFEAGWTGLGNPEVQPRRSRLTGPPTAVVGSDGRVHVFVRNGDRGISTRVLDAAGGSWSPAWRTLPGGRVQEGLAAAVDGQGLVHLFATSNTWVEHWIQRSPSGDLGRGSRRFVARPGDAPAAVTSPDGAVLLGYRPATSDRVMIERLAADRPKRWTTVANTPVSGYGRVTLAGGRRGDADGLLVAVPAAAGEELVYDITRGGVTGARFRQALGTVGSPAAVTAPDGASAVVAVGLDARPFVTRLEDVRAS